MDNDDLDLFRQQLDGVTPIAGNRVEPTRRKIAPIPAQRIADNARVLEELDEASPWEADIETGDELLYVRPGLQHKIVRRLRRGQISMEGTLDLHGNTVAQAHSALNQFLAECRARGVRGIRIIHGKGLGSADGRAVIKTKVDGWLRHRNEVAAFCSARPVDGGTGAVYVLLRR